MERWIKYYGEDKQCNKCGRLLLKGVQNILHEEGEDKQPNKNCRLLVDKILWAGGRVRKTM